MGCKEGSKNSQALQSGSELHLAQHAAGSVSLVRLKAVSVQLVSFNKCMLQFGSSDISAAAAAAVSSVTISPCVCGKQDQQVISAVVKTTNVQPNRVMVKGGREEGRKEGRKPERNGASSNRRYTAWLTR